MITTILELSFPLDEAGFKKPDLLITAFNWLYYTDNIICDNITIETSLTL
jgi:hypothetical protein